MIDDEGSITRRRVLTALATAGGIGALGGAGTYAVFSDTASTRATFTSGSLDLRVHYDNTYEGAETQTNSGTIDGQGSAELPGYDDLKPGDSGQMKFCFELTTNPAYLWVCGDLTTSNDLADAIEATVHYCDPKGEVIAEGSLKSVFGELAGGIPLDYKGRDRDAGNQAAYEPSSSSGETTGPCFCIDWKLPDDAGNEIQKDGVSFDLRFHAMQARHHDGTDNPCSSGGGDSGGDDGDDGNNDNDGSSRKAISFVAFGYTGDGPEIELLEITETKDGGEPLAIEWETDVAIERVVLKTGGGKLAIENFDGGTSGTAAVGEGKSRNHGQVPSDPYEDGPEIKYEYGGGSFTRE